jgi:hypothetical protein
MGGACGKDFVEIDDTCVYRDSINAGMPGAPVYNHRGTDRTGVVRSESGGVHLLEVEVDAGESSSGGSGNEETQQESFWESMWPLIIGVAAFAIIYYFISARRHRRQMRHLRGMDRRDPERGGIPLGPVHWAPPVWQGPLPGAPPHAVIIEPPQQQQPQQLVPPRVPQP